MGGGGHILCTGVLDNQHSLNNEHSSLIILFRKTTKCQLANNMSMKTHANTNKIKISLRFFLYFVVLYLLCFHNQNFLASSVEQSAGRH